MVKIESTIIVYYRSVGSKNRQTKLILESFVISEISSECVKDNQITMLDNEEEVKRKSSVPTFVEVGRAQKRSSSNASHPEIISDKF